MRFGLGLLSLEQRAEIEALYWQILEKLARVASRAEYVPEELEPLQQSLADTYYCNFSVFQSAPDAWAINQLFPIAPIHRLHEEPTRQAVLADLTCDSDGLLKRFIDRRDVKSALEVHEWSADKPYYLGLFLVGAYQEILGDLHNGRPQRRREHDPRGPRLRVVRQEAADRAPARPGRGGDRGGPLVVRGGRLAGEHVHPGPRELHLPDLATSEAAGRRLHPRCWCARAPTI